jgi:hypothetical protein
VGGRAGGRTDGPGGWVGGWVVEGGVQDRDAVTRDVNKTGAMQGDQKTSNIVTAVPVLPLSGVPTGLRVTGVRAEQISVAWDALPGATYYQVEYQLASLAYEPMTHWVTYGSPPARILGTEVTIAIDTAQSGQVFNVRVSAFNAHVATSSYPGFVGPSVSVQARPVAPPSPPSSLSLHPAAARILYRGMALVTGESEVRLLDAAAVASAQLGLQAVAGARLEIMDGSYRGATRFVTTFTASASSLSLETPLKPSDQVAEVAEDIYGGNSAVANKTFVRLSREAASEGSAVLGWAAVRDARRYHLQERHSDEIHLAGADLPLKEFSEIATVGSR